MKNARRTTAAYHVYDEEGMAETVKLDFDSIPEFVKDDLATAALEDFLEFIKHPDARAILDANKERLRREGSTLLDPVPKKLKGAKA